MTKKPCVLGEYCRAHGFIHGAEAEELRARIENVIAQAGKIDDEAREVLLMVRNVLDDVDARDSLAYREMLDRQLAGEPSQEDTDGSMPTQHRGDCGAGPADGVGVLVPASGEASVSPREAGRQVIDIRFTPRLNQSLLNTAAGMLQSYVEAHGDSLSGAGVGSAAKRVARGVVGLLKTHPDVRNTTSRWRDEACEAECSAKAARITALERELEELRGVDAHWLRAVLLDSITRAFEALTSKGYRLSIDGVALTKEQFTEAIVIALDAGLAALPAAGGDAEPPQEKDTVKNGHQQASEAPASSAVPRGHEGAASTDGGSDRQRAAQAARGPAARAPQAGEVEAPQKCPHCHEGVNSVDHGGNERCFHCDRCGYIGCMWTRDEKREMLVKSAAGDAERLRALLTDPVFVKMLSDLRREETDSRETAERIEQRSNGPYEFDNDPETAKHYRKMERHYHERAEILEGFAALSASAAPKET
jgi:hypothetical protein